MIPTIQNVLLGAIVVLCWLGCVGMLRMREPIQALNYLSFPAAVAAVLLPFAFLCLSGWSIATLKAAMIALLLLASNSVVTHATARAIRVRALGHWEPREEDDIEYVHGSKEKQPE
ncbi:MAG TPA: monovalent cation/H(+) antiporter subunit G [Candidatus Angelobacter sp.]|nr:monovalent cation/H(+) antiporter subunit G [Candidatus Angelobacter sp.]